MYTKVLKDINLKFHSKQITMIIGDTGSGKSSILHAILNEMKTDKDSNSHIQVNGSLAYSSQKPWMISGTLMENIIFNEPYDEKRLTDAIHYACLEDDLKLFSNGLETQIGEKGINLSGGQKARVSLARALYSNKDIYLLDDILSAVDVHVGKFLIDETISSYLYGKTIIMPTHAVHFADRADNVVIIQKGEIVRHGKYYEIEKTAEFKDICQTEEKKKEEIKRNTSK